MKSSFLMFLSMILVTSVSYGKNAFRENMTNSTDFLYYGEDLTSEAENGLYFNLGLEFFEEALVTKDLSTQNKTGLILDNSLVTPFGLFIRSNRWTFGLNSKYITTETGPDSVGLDRSNSGLGDTELSLGFDFLKRKKSSTGIVLRGTFETGDETYFTSFGSPSYSAELYHTHRFGRLLTSGSVGYRKASDGKFTTFDLSEMIKLTYGINYRLSDKWSLGLEGFKEINLTDTNKKLNPNNNYLLVKYDSNKRLNLWAGYSASNFGDKNDGRDYRVSVGMKYLLFQRKKSRVIERPVVVVEKPIETLIPENLVRNEIVYFDTASSALKVKGIMKVLKFMKDNGKDRTVYLYGNTDPRGSSLYNYKLSRRRAEAVKRQLRAFGYRGKIVTFYKGEWNADQRYVDESQRNVQILLEKSK